MNQFEIKMVRVSDIRIVNSRNRHLKKYEEIKRSVNTLGLKNPIIVAPRKSDDGISYDLICGEGRLGIYKNANEEYIPARIIDCDKKSVLLMGLVENIARRQGNPGALINEIKRLRKEGFSQVDIAQKIGLGSSYIYEIVALLERGEEQIVDSVINGHMPLSVAIKISNCSDDIEEQRIIGEAYNSREIKPGHIRYVKNLIERRKLYGKGKSRRVIDPKNDRQNIVNTLIRDMKKKKDFIERANICEKKLAFIRGAFREFMSDEGFMILLRAENISTLPSVLLSNGK